jgi:hypothetical protein
MKKIWKFPLETDYGKIIKMPKNAEILCSQIQNGTLCIWALIEDTAELETRKFIIVATGQIINFSITGLYCLSHENFIRIFNSTGGG